MISNKKTSEQAKKITDNFLSAIYGSSCWTRTNDLSVTALH